MARLMECKCNPYSERTEGVKFRDGYMCGNCGGFYKRDDPVDHPSHYTSRGIECIQVTEMFNFNKGNVIKYVWRAGEKSRETEIEDLKKAMWYLEREIKRLETVK